MALATAALAEIALHQLSAAAADCERAQAAIRANRQNQPRLFVLLAPSRAEAARTRAEKARALASVLEARLILGELDLRDLAQAGAAAKGKRLLRLARKAEAAASGG